TFFDGKALSPGGGPLEASKNKYDDYRKIIDEKLLKPSGAAVGLKVERAGGALKIAATAEAKKAADGGPANSANLRLRLALVEEQVRYRGGTGLRFHPHVARAMPGGPSGKALADGKASAEVSVNLGELRQKQEQYLSDFTKKSGRFPAALPPIELAKLS